MLNPHEAAEQRAAQARDTIAQASYEHYQCATVIELRQSRMAELNTVIQQAEIVLDEVRAAQVDFTKWRAEEEDALTMEDLGAAIQQGDQSPGETNK